MCVCVCVCALAQPKDFNFELKSPTNMTLSDRLLMA